MEHKLTTIATFNTPAEAELTRIFLEEGGITAYLADAETVGMNWMFGVGVGGVKLQVAEADVRRATGILAGRKARAAAGDDYGLRPRVAWAAGRDDEEEEEDEPGSAADSDATRAWRAAVIGLLLLPPLLHIYSAFLLLQLPWAEGALSPAGKRKALAAAVVDALVLGFVILLICSLAAPPLVMPNL